MNVEFGGCEEALYVVWIYKGTKKFNSIDVFLGNIADH